MLASLSVGLRVASEHALQGSHARDEPLSHKPWEMPRFRGCFPVFNRAHEFAEMPRSCGRFLVFT